ncbi:hypothetical protein [Thioalkalivibrio sp. ALE16]|uniref:hypothetical protein n=1 Tax=Thioalkalivibrio sp. ALE16 TaxID=1158172 RepID=UPI000372B160|nr:hypothetical protein [Thioalkalivibrio sp. ALE16]
MSLPNFIIVGTLGGVSRKDAWAYVRGLAERQCSSLEATWINITKHEGGFAYEIQEAGGRSVLKEVIGRMCNDAAIAIPLAGDRWAEVHQEDGEVFSLIVEVPTENAERIEYSQAGASDMTPYYNDGRVIATLGLAATGVGGAALLSALAVYVMTLTAPVSEHAGAHIELPIEALQHHQKALGPGEYIREFRFESGRYAVDTHTPEASTDAEFHRQLSSLEGML